MKRTITTILLSSAVMMAASAANAEPRWPNWYVGLHGSMVFIDDNDVGGNALVDKFDQDTGYGYGVSLGYRPPLETSVWRNMRLEAQWHHQRSDINKVSTPTGSVTGQGDVRLNAGLFNIYYDAPIALPGVKPYVGAGIGWGKLELKNAVNTLNTAGADDEDSAFVWNLMAGIGYAPTWLPYAEWTLGYRYLNVGTAEFAEGNGGGSFEVDYDSHNLEAGAKFLF